MNPRQNTFIIGDIHGCFNKLLILLKAAQVRPAVHRIILLGDLINKGPHSFKTLNWAKEHKADVILGNHELKFIRAVENNLPLPPPLEKLKTQMGGELNRWTSWLKTWPVYIEEKDFLAVHAGIIPGEHPKQSKVEWLVNIRYWNGAKPINTNSSSPAWHDLYTGSKLVVYAHWAKQGLKIKPNSIGLDTGCVYGGKLTGLWLPERKIIQTP